MQSLEDAKNPVSISHIEANTVVADKQHILTFIYTLANADNGLVLFACEFDGIGQQVPIHLRDQCAITVDGRQPGDFPGDHPVAEIAFQSRDYGQYKIVQAGWLQLESRFPYPAESQKVF